MNIAAILFGIAALGGAVMAAMRLGGRELPPTALAVAHGLIAASGLVMLVVSVKGQEVPAMVRAATAGFILAALGGAAMFFLYHLKKRALPIPLMLIHATAAVGSFALLLAGIFWK